LAVLNASAGQYVLANEYALQAINRCPANDPYDKSLAIRSYAVILFQQENLPEGRKRFDDAVKLLANSGLDKNLIHINNGMIYQIWASYENVFAPADNNTQKLLEKAKEEYNQIDIQMVKQQALNKLGVLPVFEDMPQSQGNSLSLRQVTQGLSQLQDIFTQQQQIKPEASQTEQGNQAMPQLPGAFGMFAKQQQTDPGTNANGDAGQVTP
jgi:tetratricopeptide (TPR) repeat protein